MDGFDSSKGLVILAATNRPEVLDKALLRPGRFDRRIIVEKPDLKGREDILRVHIKHVKTEPDINLHEMALATSGAAGADLANMVNEAALRAVRCNRKTVSQEDLMEAVEVIIAGKEKKDRILSEKEKRIVSFHEVGHALATAVQKHTQPVHKITIVPRTMGSLGYTMQMPEEEERYLMSKDEIVDQITVFLAGRAAEELVFNVQTTGASNDIERATSSSSASITGAVAAIAEPPQIDEPTPIRQAVLGSTFIIFIIINATISDIEIVPTITGRLFAPTCAIVLKFSEKPRITTAHCRIFFDVNFIPPDSDVRLASFGNTSVSIIPRSIAITGAPISSKENPPMLIPPVSVAAAAMTAHMAVPGIIDFSFFIFSPFFCIK